SGWGCSSCPRSCSATAGVSTCSHGTTRPRLLCSCRESRRRLSYSLYQDLLLRSLLSRELTAVARVEQQRRVAIGDGEARTVGRQRQAARIPGHGKARHFADAVAIVDDNREVLEAGDGDAASIAR